MATGIKLKDLIECKFCGEPFERGTGHLCFCPECAAKDLPAKHPMCDPCYQEAVKDGTIKDVDYDKTALSPDLRDRIT